MRNQWWGCCAEAGSALFCSVTNGSETLLCKRICVIPEHFRARFAHSNRVVLIPCLLGNDGSRQLRVFVPTSARPVVQGNSCGRRQPLPVILVLKGGHDRGAGGCSRICQLLPSSGASPWFHGAGRRSSFVAVFSSLSVECRVCVSHTPECRSR